MLAVVVAGFVVGSGTLDAGYQTRLQERYVWNSVDVLLETGWIRPRGRRKSPGRPLTYGTSEAFLSHFGLDAVGDLPGLEELKGAGMLDGRLPPGFSVPVPSDDPALREDEDPLEPGDLDLVLAPPPERTDDD